MTLLVLVSGATSCGKSTIAEAPGWYELSRDDAERSRAHYVPLADPKVVVDAVTPLRENLSRVRAHLGLAAPHERRT